jgi:hypothetical protein
MTVGDSGGAAFRSYFNQPGKCDSPRYPKAGTVPVQTDDPDRLVTFWRTNYHVRLERIEIGRPGDRLEGWEALGGNCGMAGR